MLQARGLPTYFAGNDDVSAAWQRSKRWRFDCVDKAVRATQNIAGAGLRHAEVIRQVALTIKAPDARRIHYPGDLVKVGDGRTILTKRAIRHFCQWLREIYQWSQADVFEARLYFGNVSVDAPLVQVSVAPELFEPVRHSLDSVYELFALIDASDVPLARFFAEPMARSDELCFYVPARR